MITVDELYSAYKTFRPIPDEEQREAIEARSDKPLFIVAGPGTGKTTCLTLRILKLILVDDIPPRGILATTFTKKAAAELRSRILGWGFRLIETLLKDKKLSIETRMRISKLDINQVITGTIDSICEQILRNYRDPGTQPPIVIDDFVAKTLLLREGLFGSRRFEDSDLENFLLDLHGDSRFGFDLGRKNDLVQTIWDRRYQDQVDWNTFLRDATGRERKARKVLGEAIDAYGQALSQRGMVDFALVEQEVLNRLRAEQLKEFLRQIKVVLVDEYQDTNLLQEAIYFEIARACQGALTVVGDDDQSLYRFRGATVELFSEFAVRCNKELHRKPNKVFLTTNYRSTRTIISFVNEYAKLDSAYQLVRVKGKPALEASKKAAKGLPIFGMFRDDVATLARDLAAFIHKVFRGRGYHLSDGAKIKRSAYGGDVGDCALLCSSPLEYSFSGDARLPLLLKQELDHKEIQVFNPRGHDLTDIPVITHFGGLLLECLDPGGEIESQTNGISRDIRTTFQRWRSAAITFVESKDSPKDLYEFAVGWADRNPNKRGWEWPRSVPVLELIYSLVHFFPELHDDPEGQIYLEVFTRQVSACEQVGSFSGRVVSDSKNQSISQASVKELLRDFLGPIAAGVIKVNEELMEIFPRDRLSVVSIHQAKGLEFPLTIVDVGADFRTKHARNAFKRFPSSGGPPHAMEDLLRPYTDLAAPTRSAQDRAFDDLFRQFFVAYSRPQDVLLLVGLKTTLPGGRIPNVATGWTRSEVCRWDGANVFVEI